MSKDISSFELFEVLRVVGYVFLSTLFKIEKLCVYPEELRNLSILYLDPSKVDLMCGSRFVLQCKIAPGCGPTGQSSCF